MTTTATQTYPQPACPAWCDTPSAAAHENDQAGFGYYAHHADVLAGRVAVSVTYLQAPEWDSPEENDLGVFIEIQGDECLTPAEARTAGEALIKAASMLEGGVR